MYRRQRSWRNSTSFFAGALVENEEDVDPVERVDLLDRHVFGIAGADADDQEFLRGRMS
jgi:hypothetical protein